MALEISNKYVYNPIYRGWLTFEGSTGHWWILPETTDTSKQRHFTCCLTKNFQQLFFAFFWALKKVTSKKFKEGDMNHEIPVGFSWCIYQKGTSPVTANSGTSFQWASHTSIPYLKGFSWEWYGKIRMGTGIPVLGVWGISLNILWM